MDRSGCGKRILERIKVETDEPQSFVSGKDWDVWGVLNQTDKRTKTTSQRLSADIRRERGCRTIYDDHGCRGD